MFDHQEVRKPCLPNTSATKPSLKIGGAQTAQIVPRTIGGAQTVPTKTTEECSRDETACMPNPSLTNLQSAAPSACVIFLAPFLMVVTSALAVMLCFRKASCSGRTGW